MSTLQTAVSLPPSARNLFLAGLSLFAAGIAVSKSASNIMIGLVYLGMGLLALRHQATRTHLGLTWRQPLLWPLALYLFVAVIGLINTGNIADGMGIVNKMSGLVLVYLMVSVVLDMAGDREGEARTAHQVLAAFLIGITALDVIGILTYIGVVGHKKFFVPLQPLHVHHIWFSNLNAVGIYTAAAFLLFGQRTLSARDKAFFFLFLAIAAVCVLLSISRTAWNGLLVTAFVLVSLMLKKKRNILFVLTGLLGIVVLAYSFSSIVRMRMDLIVSDIASFAAGGDTNTGLGARFLLWKAAFGMFLSNPFMGAGTGDFVPLLHAEIAAGNLPAFLKEYNQPHNMYLFALATNGVLGLAALLFIFYGILKRTVPVIAGSRENGFFAFLAAATAIHFLVGGMSDSFFNIQMLRYAFAFVIGVCLRRSLYAESAA